MNAAPSFFRSSKAETPRTEARVQLARLRKIHLERQRWAREEDDGRFDKFWQWFALAVLAFCWIAEASMCAARGF